MTIRRILMCVIITLTGPAFATFDVLPGSRLEKACFLNYINSIAISTCTHTYMDYGVSQSYLKRNFTTDGWREYDTYLSTQLYQEFLNDNEYSALCSILKPPKILRAYEKKITGRNYAYTELVVPVRVTFLREKANPVVREQELMMTIRKRAKGTEYGKVDSLTVRSFVNPRPEGAPPLKKDEPEPFDYDVKPSPICDIKVESGLKKPLHSDLELRLWIDEALANGYGASTGAQFFTADAWKSFLLIHKLIDKNVQNSLEDIFVYDPGIMPALIKKRGEEDRRYKWHVFKWYKLKQEEQETDVKLDLVVSRIGVNQGVRGIVIESVSRIPDAQPKTPKATSSMLDKELESLQLN